jgi:hypothetical protein
MAQAEQIYARLFRHADAVTSLLLKQDLVNAEFVRRTKPENFLPNSMQFKMLH